MRRIAEPNLQHQEKALYRGLRPAVEAQEAMRADPGGSTKKLKKRAIAIVLENDNESSAVGLHRLERQGHMMQAESIGIWAKVVQGFPSDQLHFILNATVDTLPHNSFGKRYHKPPVHNVESNRH